MRFESITLSRESKLTLMLVALSLALSGCAWIDWDAWWADNEIGSRSRVYQERGLSKQDADRNARYDYIQRRNEFPP